MRQAALHVGKSGRTTAHASSHTANIKHPQSKADIMQARQGLPAMGHSIHTEQG